MLEDFIDLENETNIENTLRTTLTCTMLSARYQTIDESGAEIFRINEESAVCDESQTQVDSDFRSLLERVFTCRITGNELFVQGSNGVTFVFFPGYIKRLERSPNVLVNGNIQSKLKEEYDWIDDDSFASIAFQKNIDVNLLTDDEFNLLDSLTSTPIYVSPDCPDDGTSLSSDKFLVIFTVKVDGGEFRHGTGTTCEIDLLGGRRFHKDQILAALNQI